MNKSRFLATGTLSAIFLGVALCVASSAFCQEFDLSQWQDSSERKAGTRMTIKVGNVECGFVWIPAGEFVMGSPTTERGRNENEAPIRVKLTRGFWMLETEVTQGLYQETTGANPSGDKGKFLPVDHITRDAAVKFCEELSKRLPQGGSALLPTEAQWEYACRAGTKTAYSYGDVADSSQMNAQRSDGVKVVKSFPANRWGLFDMHGNVAEWTRDGYVKTYSVEYGTGVAVDPECAEEGGKYVVRGGSYVSRPEQCRSAWRATSGAHALVGADCGVRPILVCE